MVTTSRTTPATQLRSRLKRVNNNNKPESRYLLLQQFYGKYVNYKFIKFLIFDAAALPIVAAFIIAAELLLNVFIIGRVAYTEIDWIAYMQECEGFLNGTTDYALLKGSTGPLVYPAGFVYIYAALYFVTAHGRNVRLAQYIFAGIYLLQLLLVLRLYAKSRKVPPYVLALSAFTSYRIHSIYVLRLFNDPLAMLFLYAALNLFLDGRWTCGSCCYSFAVAIKMNILLFAPALLLFYLTNLGWRRTLGQLAVCAALQLFVGAPFLLTHPYAYLRGSFDVGRVFEHQWTVNYRFLERSFFEHRAFHVALLLLHLLLLGICSKPMFVYFKNYVRLRTLQKQLEPQIVRQNEQIKQQRITEEEEEELEKRKNNVEDESLTRKQLEFLKSFERGLQKSSGLTAPPPPVATPTPPDIRPADATVNIHFEQCTQLALLPFFVCNLVGVVCARSLHYQFYVWYFHSLPHLAWSTNYSLPIRFLILGLIELCWNTFPSTNFSSITLHVCHIVLLFGVLRGMWKTAEQSATISRQLPNKEEEEEQQQMAPATPAAATLTTSKAKTS